MRLRRADLGSPGIRRRRRGRGFGYLTTDGEPLQDKDTIERISALAIPPAWRHVWISPYQNDHIQAVGVDDAGRRQYLYHPEWRRARDEEKHERVLALARRLPRLREAVQEDLDSRGLTRNRVLAGALRMIDLGVFRTGGESYADEHGTHGVATLLCEHVELDGECLVCDYPAKHGIQRKVRLRDESLVRLVRSLRRARGGEVRLLAYRDSAGWHDVKADDINERLKELVGEDFTAKDLRTWNATVLAASAFAGKEKPSSARGLKRVEKAVMTEVAEGLGNTPTVARQSYVDPRVIEAYEKDRTIERAVRRAAKVSDPNEARTIVERAVVRLIGGS
ncbi:DNA topoisomerase IB [Amycolatopsis regifaucium]|uniref:DNA topoisomerase n=1 Tax=Amycolatopsis regifaucium TaxID=546365 RepID=A0A154MEF8_9PSEU|nr:DNA topoisomerase IB [Amycolatopsis regifaucium]KZB82911.1 DNA topoisomerase [Amycolatopsis regifaucium]OKA03350.1 DNA topoisomerase [Amycolatopsis regifaucium]SFJ67927.1 DNA topoisomerase IB [Amycolatopsis regifaucium]